MNPLPSGQYGVIYADPPWKFKAGTKGRPQHYKRMTLEEIKAMPVRGLAEPHCWLFIWTTGPHLQQVFDVLKAWGFRYSGLGFVWIKLNKNATTLFFTDRDLFKGQGYTTRKNAEFCLLAKRGRPKRIHKDALEVCVSPRREHSRKPDEFLSRIERFAQGPYLELFARSQREGWTSWGDETEKFSKPLLVRSAS